MTEKDKIDVRFEFESDERASSYIDQDLDFQDPFFYQNLTDKLKGPKDFVEHERYRAAIGYNMPETPHAEDLIYTVLWKGDPPPPVEGNVPREDFKIHISLSEELEGGRHINRAKGWNIVQKVLRKHLVGGFKIIREKYDMSEDLKEIGKDITIYAGHDRHLTVTNWENIMREITRLFIKAKVEPGFAQVPSLGKQEKLIRGSSYFGYRYEKGTPTIDPFEQVDLGDIPGQSPRIIYQGKCAPSGREPEFLKVFKRPT